jgi:hypothetical protein
MMAPAAMAKKASKFDLKKFLSTVNSRRARSAQM